MTIEVNVVPSLDKMATDLNLTSPEDAVPEWILA